MDASPLIHRWPPLYDAGGGIVPVDTCPCGRPKLAAKERCCDGCDDGDHSAACYIRSGMLDCPLVPRVKGAPLGDVVCFSVSPTPAAEQGRWPEKKHRLHAAGAQDRASGRERRTYGYTHYQKLYNRGYDGGEG